MKPTTIGILHPGEMGSEVGASARAGGARVIWASEGRGGATRDRAAAAGLEDVGSLRALVAASDVILSGPEEVYAAFAPLMEDLKREVFRVAMLDAQNGLLRDRVVSEGTLSASLVHPREVFKPAILESAASVRGRSSAPASWSFCRRRCIASSYALFGASSDIGGQCTSAGAVLAEAAEKGPSASLAPLAARSTYREYASRAAGGRRLASGPFEQPGTITHR